MRIRTVKPEFFTHDALFEAEKKSKLPLRLAFIGLWCASDREGRFKWEPRRLGISIMPYDGVDFSRVLDACVTGGFVVKYRVGLQWFGQIPSFRRHQVINPRESGSTIPELSKADEVIDASGTRGSRVATGDVLARGEGKGREGKGREGEGGGTGALPVGNDPEPEPEVADAVFLKFPIIGSSEPWPLMESKLAEYQQTFVGLDVRAVMQLILQWLRDNPAKRKTANGMPRFLGSWLTREQNRRGGRMQNVQVVGTPVQPISVPENLKPGFKRDEEPDDDLWDGMGQKDGGEL